MFQLGAIGLQQPEPTAPTLFIFSYTIKRNKNIAELIKFEHKEV